MFAAGEHKQEEEEEEIERKKRKLEVNLVQLFQITGWKTISPNRH